MVVLRGIKKKPLKQILVVQARGAMGTRRDVVEYVVDKTC